LYSEDWQLTATPVTSCFLSSIFLKVIRVIPVPRTGWFAGDKDTSKSVKVASIYKFFSKQFKLTVVLSLFKAEVVFMKYQ
jgi:hypothetical protein